MILPGQNNFGVFRRLFLRFSAITLVLICGFLFGSAQAYAATLYAGSANQVVYEGQSFVVEWFLDTEGVSLNTIDLRLKYTSDTLRVVGTDVGNSLLSLWIKQPSVNPTAGLIELTGGAPNGFIGSNIPIFRTTFESINTGIGRVEMMSESKALKNDGQGSPDNLFFSVLEFPIIIAEAQPGKINSKTHPDQNQWYHGRDVIINFVVESQKEYSYSFSSNLELFPDDKADPFKFDLNYDNLPDGIYYFKLNVKSPGAAWEEAGVYRVKIDATPPVSFQPEIGSEAEQKFVSFSTVDKTSGMLHYKVKVGLFGKEKVTESPFKLKRPVVGDNVVVEAYDAAGNKQTSTVDYPGLISVRLFTMLLVLLGVASIAWFVLKISKTKPTSKTIENR